MTLRDSLSHATTRVRHRLGVYNLQDVGKGIANAMSFEKRRRSLVTQTVIESVDKIIDQPWPYFLLKKYANRHPFLRIVHGARIREAIKNRWDVVEKFAKKCVTCGREFTDPVKECPDCKEAGFLRDPNPQEKTRLEQFLKNPNRDDEMVDIIKSVFKDNLAVDDWYLSVVQMAPNQYALYVEDASELYLCADKHARLGNGVWFCSTCWRHGTHEKTYLHRGNCPSCGGPLKETAYVHKNQKAEITARYGRNDIIHGNSDPWLPQLYGNSKVIAVLIELRTALAMQSFSFDTYTKGVLDKIIALKGELQTKADEIAKSAKEQRDKITIDAYTGRVGRETRGSLWVGTKEGIDVHDVMPDPQKMQSLEWMEFWFVKIVGGIYGVQPVMMNAPTRGPGGYFQRMQLIVEHDATKEQQRIFEDPFNEQFVEGILGIRDWRFQFNEIEARNEMEEAQIWQSKVTAGRLAVEAGLDAELTEEGELKISGTFEKPEVPSEATHYLMPKPPKIPAPKMPQAFSQEKMQKGKSWLVRELDESDRDDHSSG